MVQRFKLNGQSSTRTISTSILFENACKPFEKNITITKKDVTFGSGGGGGGASSGFFTLSLSWIWQNSQTSQTDENHQTLDNSLDWLITLSFLNSQSLGLRQSKKRALQLNLAGKYIPMLPLRHYTNPTGSPLNLEFFSPLFFAFFLCMLVHLFTCLLFLCLLLACMIALLLLHSNSWQCVYTVYSLQCVYTVYSLQCVYTVYSLQCVYTVYSLQCVYTVQFAVCVHCVQFAMYSVKHVYTFVSLQNDHSLQCVYTVSSLQHVYTMYNF